jgi:hypothetical protein
VSELGCFSAAPKESQKNDRQTTERDCFILSFGTVSNDEKDHRAFPRAQFEVLYNVIHNRISKVYSIIILNSGVLGTNQLDRASWCSFNFFSYHGRLNFRRALHS